MNTRVVITGAALLAMLTGCQSAPWRTAGSKLGFGKSLASKESRTGDDVELISKDDLTHSRRNRRAGSDAADAAPRESSATAQAALKRGHKAEADGQLKQAKGFYHQALEAEPKNVLAHHRLAIIADKESDFKTAQEHYLAALSVNRNNPNLLSDLGYSFLLQNRTDESKYYLEQALQADPKHVRAINNLGLLHARQGDYDTALAMFRQTGTEAEVAEKMRELFPSGRPQGSGPSATNEPLFASQPRQRGLPNVTPAAVGASPWGDAERNDRVQPADGQFPSGERVQIGSLAANDRRSPQIGVSEAGNPFGESRQAATSGGSAAGRPFPTDQNSAPEPPLNSRQTPSRPEDALEEWPHPAVSSSAPRQGQAAPFPMDADWPQGTAMAPANQRPADRFPAGNDVRTISAVGGPGGAAPAGVHINAHHQRPASSAQLDPRQQAAMLGLNAGPGGVFPMSYGNAAPAQNPSDAPGGLPHDDTAPANHEPIAPSGATSAHFEAPVPAGAFGDARDRTAARPISQPPAAAYSRQQAVAPGFAPQYPQQRPAQQYQQGDTYATPNPQPYPNTGYAEPNRQPLPQYDAQRPQYSAGQYSQPQYSQPQYAQPQHDQRYGAQPASSPYPPQQPRESRFTPRPAAESQPFPMSAPAFNPGNTYQPGAATR